MPWSSDMRLASAGSALAVADSVLSNLLRAGHFQPPAAADSSSARTAGSVPASPINSAVAGEYLKNWQSGGALHAHHCLATDVPCDTNLVHQSFSKGGLMSIETVWTAAPKARANYPRWHASRPHSSAAPSIAILGAMASDTGIVHKMSFLNCMESMATCIRRVLCVSLPYYESIVSKGNQSEGNLDAYSRSTGLDVQASHPAHRNAAAV
jgi:hypothetical protein